MENLCHNNHGHANQQTDETISSVPSEEQTANQHAATMAGRDKDNPGNLIPSTLLSLSSVLFCSVLFCLRFSITAQSTSSEPAGSTRFTSTSPPSPPPSCCSGRTAAAETSTTRQSSGTKKTSWYEHYNMGAGGRVERPDLKNLQSTARNGSLFPHGIFGGWEK